MTNKPVVPRALARRDIELAVDYYCQEGGVKVADRFVAAFRTVCRSIGSRPKLGSPSHGYELDIPGLRCRRLTKFPYLVFYLEREDHIDIWRVLHAHRDMPRAIAEPKE